MSAEIIAELRKLADFTDADTYDECWEIKETARGKLLRAAAARLNDLERENARLRAALEFYANKDNHKMRREPSYRDRFSQNMKPGKPKLGRVSEDKGKRARAALEERAAALAGSGE